MAVYDDSGEINAAIGEFVAIARKVIPVKTVVDIDGTKEKISSSMLPAIIHIITGVGQQPTSGGARGSYTINVGIKVLVLAEERTQKKLGKNLTKTIQLMDAYFRAIRGEERTFENVAVKPIQRSGGPIGTVSYAGIDYNGTVIDADIQIYPGE